MGKKGQITAFMLLGIVIVIAVIIGLYLKSYSGNNKISFDSGTISGYVTDCITKVSGEGIVALGNRGGYIYPSNYVNTPSDDVSFLASNLSNNVPSVTDIEEQLSRYVEENLAGCLDNPFTLFRKQGWGVRSEEPKAKVLLAENDVKIEVDMSIKVTDTEMKEINVDHYITSQAVRLKYIRETVDEMTETYILTGRWVDATLLEEYQNGTTITTYNNETITIRRN